MVYQSMAMHRLRRQIDSERTAMRSARPSALFRRRSRCTESRYTVLDSVSMDNSGD